MSNHGFISSKKILKKENVLEDIQEINQRRFKGLLNIDSSNWGSNGAWFINYLDPKVKSAPSGFNLWIRSIRKLEHSHGIGWIFYLELVFANELATKYGGKLSDDAFSGVWEPDVSKYTTYENYIKMQKSQFGDEIPIKLINELMEIEMRSMPKVFSGL